MTAPDWSSDCSTLFNKYSCPLLLAIGAALFSVFVWYATRIETKTEQMQEALHQIQLDVAVIRGRQSPATFQAPEGIAMAQADAPVKSTNSRGCAERQKWSGIGYPA